jgi:hypothetical protein
MSIPPDRPPLLQSFVTNDDGFVSGRYCLPVSSANSDINQACSRKGGGNGARLNKVLSERGRGRERGGGERGRRGREGMDAAGVYQVAHYFS